MRPRACIWLINRAANTLFSTLQKMNIIDDYVVSVSGGRVDAAIKKTNDTVFYFIPIA